MSRIYDKDNKVVPVTILGIIPSQVIDHEGNKSLVIATNKNANKPQMTTLSKAEFKKGQVFDQVADLYFYDESGKLDWEKLAIGETCYISGISKGKGFSGVIKKHGFHRGPKSHGSDHHRAPGSIGSGYPQRVVLGKKLPGHSGAVKISLKNVKIVEMDKEKNLLAVKGPVPGANKSYIQIIKK